VGKIWSKAVAFNRAIARKLRIDVVDCDAAKSVCDRDVRCVHFMVWHGLKIAARSSVLVGKAPAKRAIPAMLNGRITLRPMYRTVDSLRAKDHLGQACAGECRLSSHALRFLDGLPGVAQHWFRPESFR
jgi:hypothetical protein